MGLFSVVGATLHCGLIGVKSKQSDFATFCPVLYKPTCLNELKGHKEETPAS